MLKEYVYASWRAGNVRIVYLQEDDRMPFREVQEYFSLNRIYSIQFRANSRIWDSILGEALGEFQKFMQIRLQTSNRGKLIASGYERYWENIARRFDIHTRAREFYDTISTLKMIDIQEGNNEIKFNIQSYRILSAIISGRTCIFFDYTMTV
ncbi:hypothetical protein QAD02_000176 [Eretmocerus hayati]|uniref:Uncharacterized protein n=1 Tax=Eretmocerus hayati TaxID=131215 RepID=A0ACC2NCY7_9HYME|nr:hypothetical protein QAD02_000176 [Eretmocerus hayati]